jgi:hypothetical protein
MPQETRMFPVGAAEGCDLLILIFGRAEITKDQKIAGFASSYIGIRPKPRSSK